MEGVEKWEGASRDGVGYSCLSSDPSRLPGALLLTTKKDGEVARSLEGRAQVPQE